MIPTVSNPVYLWLLLLLLPLTYLYVQWPSVTEKAVPALTVWKRSGGGTKGARKYRRIIKFFEWLTASLFLIFVTLAAADPSGARSGGGPATVHIVLDNSYSMLAIPGNSNRTLLQSARNRLSEFSSNLPPRTQWRLHTIAPVPGLLSAGSTGKKPDPDDVKISRTGAVSHGRVRKYLQNLLENSSGSDRIIFFTDGNVKGLKTLLQQFERFHVNTSPSPMENAGITDASLKTNWRGVPETLSVAVSNYTSGGRQFAVNFYPGTRGKSVHVGQNETERVSMNIDEMDSPEIGAVLEQDDSFSQDNATYFHVVKPRSIPVYVVGTSQTPFPFIRGAVDAIGPPLYMATNQPISRKRFLSDPEMPADKALLISDGVNVSGTEEVLGHIHFGPTPAGPESGRKTTYQEEGRVTPVAPDPVLRELQFGELEIKKGSYLVAGDNSAALLTSPGGTIAVRDRLKNHHRISFGFRLADSNFPALPEFPLLVRNFVRLLMKKEKSGQPSHFLEVGAPWTSSGNVSLRRKLLSGKGREKSAENYRIKKGESFFPPLPGWYVPEKTDTGVLFAANLLSRFESKLDVNRNLSGMDNVGQEVTIRSRKRSPLDRYLLLLGLCSILLHWGIRTAS